MNISNKNTYHNSIYNALILDKDDTAKIYQLYIPAIHNTLENIYPNYIKASNKKDSIYRKYFPWASSTIEGLEIGDVVYIGFINNNIANILIIGKDLAATGSVGSGGGNLEIYTTDVLALTMPIIMNQEVGLPINAWPDNIGDSRFGTINCNDEGCWSIGLLQWRAARAYDLCYSIAKKDTNWESNFPDKSIDLVTCLKASLKANSILNQKGRFGEGYILTKNSNTYKGIYNLLTSETGKQVQKEKASEDTAKSIDILQNTFNVSNVALIIFCADIMNQYGNGINNSANSPNLKGCLDEAGRLSKDTSKNIMEQFEAFYKWWDDRTNLYMSRRKTVRSYIKELEKQGKLFLTNLVDLGPAFTSKYIPEAGEYYWPVPDSDQINCYWGYVAQQYERHNAGFKYNWAGLEHGGFHTGIDIGPKKCGVDGDPLIAVGSGTVAFVNGGGVDHHGSLPANWDSKKDGPSQGNCIIIQMDKNKDHYFAYMHLCKAPTLKVGDRVKAGDVVGYMGTTGSSTGTHLHIGLHLKTPWPKPSNSSTKPDPLPYFGRNANA